MKDNTLTIRYKLKDHHVDHELDDDLGDLLEKFGFCRWANGCSVSVEGVRNLVFEVSKNAK